MKRFANKYFFILILPLLFAIQGCTVKLDLNSMMSGESDLDSETLAPVSLEDETEVKDPLANNDTNAQNDKTKDNKDDKNNADEELINLSSNSGILDIDSGGRTSPFVPYRERNISYTSVNFGDLPLPPEAGDMDEDLNTLISAKVTGILYEENSPSAIINVMDEDYLVKPGDKVETFEISAITKDYVAVKTGSNVYRAKVGDIVDGELYGTGVYNLGHRFAGTRHPSRNEDILIVKTKNKHDNTSGNNKDGGDGSLKDLSLPPIPELSNVLPKLKLKTQAGEIPLPTN